MQRSDVSAPSAEYDVLTPERVSLRYDIAGIGSRSAAALVDVAIQGTVWVALLIDLAAGLGLSASRFDDLDSSGAATAIILGGLAVVTFVVLWGYYLFFEIAWSGQTPGKRLLGLRVMRENGYPIRPGDAVVRNLVRIVDGPPVAYPIGLLVMLLNDRARRAGDFAAGTVVVREGRRSHGELPAGMIAAADPPGAVALLRADDATLVRDVLLRGQGMDSEARLQLEQRLAEALARRYGLAERRRGAVSDRAFLELLVANESAAR